MAKFVKSARILGEDRATLTAQVTQRYVAGESIRQLADHFGRSYGFIHYIIIESGTPMRARGGVKSLDVVYRLIFRVDVG